MTRALLAVITVCCLLAFACGCVTKVGVVAPTWGRTSSTISGGADLHLPLSMPEEAGKTGTMLVLPFEDYRTTVERQSDFSKGALRVSSLGGEFRIMHLLFHKDIPGKEAAPFGGKEEYEFSQEAPKLHKHRDKTLTFFWFGAGPEYHWNKFVVSSTDLAVAADDNVTYDETWKNGWGGRISFGIRTLTRTHGPETGRVTGGIGINLEVSWHFANTWIEQRGIDNTVPFRRVREDRMEWVSFFAGLVYEF